MFAYLISIISYPILTKISKFRPLCAPYCPRQTPFPTTHPYSLKHLYRCIHAGHVTVFIRPNIWLCVHKYNICESEVSLITLYWYFYLTILDLVFAANSWRVMQQQVMASLFITTRQFNWHHIASQISQLPYRITSWKHHKSVGW